MTDHPELDINFIYNELENYTTGANVRADNAYDALRQTIGLNPVTVVKARNSYYIEALQRGKYIYTGRAAGSDGEPVAAATVMLLSPGDSTVVTYGVADADGRFKIPCDRANVIAKLSCIGYKTTYHDCRAFNLGTITMPELAIKLGEVKVEADNAMLSSDRSTFIPTKRQKNAAQNATDLLQHMALPLIRINPVNNAVTDNAGNGVALYINSLEASREELNGMRMADILRVEYLEFPADPRFHGAPRVINFILREYEYGGYTKLSVREKALTGFSNHAEIFARFSFKKMTYDVYAGSENENNHHTGHSTESNYRLTTGSGEPLTLTRNELTEKSHYQQDAYPVTFRATYNANNISIRNKIGFAHKKVSRNDFSGRLIYSQAGNDDGGFRRWNPSRSNTLSYSGACYLALPDGFAIDFTPQLNYTHLNDHTGYVAPHAELNRTALENAVDYRGNLFINKNFNKKHTLLFGASHGGNINRVRYEGAENDADRFDLNFSSVLAGYRFNYDKFSAYADAGYSWETSNINGSHTNSSYPFTHINLRYAPNKKHMLSAYFQMASMTPMLSMKTSNTVQENEAYYISGNPDLAPGRLITGNLSYTWIASNQFVMSVNGACVSTHERMLAIYEPFRDGSAIKRTYINNGDWTTGEIGLSLNWKPFDGKLQLYANPRVAIYRSTGTYDDSFGHFRLSLQATYYVSNLFLQAKWESRDKTMDMFRPTVNVGRNFHSLTVGWSRSDWNLRLAVNNIFNKGWRSETASTTAPRFSESTVTYGDSHHPQISLSVTYTLGYGKKVKTGNEIGGESSAASAILK